MILTRIHILRRSRGQNSLYYTCTRLRGRGRTHTPALIHAYYNKIQSRLITNKVMLCEAVLVDADYRSRVEREVIRLVERDSLRRTIDIHTLHRTVALHDAFTSSVVSITTCLAIVREYHQAVFFLKP